MFILWNSLRFRWSIPSFRLIFMGNGLFLSFVSWTTRSWMNVSYFTGISSSSLTLLFFRFLLVLCCLYYNTLLLICQAFLLFIFRISFICISIVYCLNFLCFCNAHCASLVSTGTFEIWDIHRDFRNPGLHFRCKNNIMIYMWKDALRIVPYFVLTHLRWHSGRC